MKSIIGAAVITALLTIVMAPQTPKPTTDIKTPPPKHIAVVSKRLVVNTEKVTPKVQKPVKQAVVIPQPVLSHEQLMSAAGIPASQQPAASEIVNLESSWNPGEVEPSSGACHLEQALPCGKDGCTTANEVCQLEWAQQYVTGRYGSWQAALDFHIANGYY